MSCLSGVEYLVFTWKGVHRGMNIVFMVMCHKNAKQVIRLVHTLLREGVFVVIHTDSEMQDIEYKVIREFVQDNQQVFLTGQHMHGELDMRSLVDITLLMIKEAVRIEASKKIHFSYYCLMSGQDYLIKPVDKILEMLIHFYPKPYIGCAPYQKTTPIFFKFDNNKETIKWTRFVNNHIHNKVLWEIFRYIRYIQRIYYRIRKKTSRDILQRLHVDLYMGSAWWILPDKVISFILCEMEKKPAYIDVILDGSYTPEETFFQIMALRSPLKDMIQVRKYKDTKKDSRTWAIFTGAKMDKPFTGHPYYFESDDFQEIQKSDFWIARKFDETIDKNILDRIDKEILHIN